MKNVISIVVCFLIVADAIGATLFSNFEISEYWQRHNSRSTIEVDHDAWNEFLRRYVSASNGINLLAYDSVAQQDKRKLGKYIDYLQSIQVTELNQKEQFAYWINLYNAVTVQVVLAHYPLNSIQEISYELFSQGPWKKQLIRVEGMGLSLDNIEHQILRPIFKDNRIHYAVNCASMGCPNLQEKAYSRENLEALLDSGARQYINHPRGVSFDQGELIVSSVFDWYGEDFGENDQQIITYLMRFADADLKERLKTRKSIDNFQYDWSLNE